MMQLNRAFRVLISLLVPLATANCGMETQLASRPMPSDTNNQFDADATVADECTTNGAALKACAELNADQILDNTKTNEEVDDELEVVPVASPSPSPSASPVGDPNIIEFRIAPNTGDNPWNTANTTVVGTVNKTLRIFNDDTVTHTLHTNGRPCNHGSLIPPGGSFDCVLARTYDATANGAVYDHERNPASRFYLQVNAN